MSDTESPELQPQHFIATSCRDCVFATYQGDTQTDCSLGRIPLFVHQGTVVEQGYDVDEDWEGDETETPPKAADGKTYFHIKGRFCTACRHVESEWAKSLPPEQWHEKIREDLRTRLHVLIPVGPGDTLEQVMETLRSLAAQTLAPRAAHVAIYGRAMRSYQVINEARKHAPGLELNVRVLVENGDAWRAVDTVVAHINHKDGNFYAVFPAGSTVPATFIAEVDSALNDRLERFLLLTPDSYGRGLVVQTKVHKAIGGNEHAEHVTDDGVVIRCDRIEDKLRQLAKDDQTEYLIKRVEDVCPSLA